MQLTMPGLIAHSAQSTSEARLGDVQKPAEEIQLDRS